MPYWIWKLYKGRILILGSEQTESEAYTKGLSELGSEFELHESSTIDRTRARDEIRAKLLNQTHNLDLMLQRAKYRLEDKESK